MSPAPDSSETLVLNQLQSSAILNALSSSDELDYQQFNENRFDRGSLAMDLVDANDLSDDEDDEPPKLTEEPAPLRTICSAPSTPTGERDPPVTVRKASISSIANNDLPPIEVKYQGVGNTSSVNSDDGNSFIHTFFGCFKPFMSAVNKIGENILFHRGTTLTNGPLTKSTDDWNIPIDSIMNDLLHIGTGIEGTVYRGTLGGQNVACKRVRTEEETNIKHLRKLNHINVVKFRGVSVSAPLFYIVMEYCPYGSLYDVLKRRREKNSCTKPTQVLDWSRQISNGMNYLHSNKIVHRDLKSPNILISDNYILKISDFGTSKQMGNRRSQPMSFNGTSAWMAPEVIRQEPCSEKVDVWSFGIVVWEILTCTVPYQNIDPVAVMWGVGKGSLTLPIPSSAPEGFKLLMNMCWNQQPADRYSFQQIIKHLNISEPQIILFEQEQEYVELTRAWSAEITEQLASLPTIDISATLQMTNDELMKKRKEELQHIADIRSHYHIKLQQVNTLYLELSSLLMQLRKREQDIKKKERTLKIQHHSPTTKKRPIKSFTDARERSINLIKEASRNLQDPVLRLTQSSNKKSTSAKPPNPLSNQQTTIAPATISNDSNGHKISPSSPTTVSNNPDSSSLKNNSRRRKVPGHRRNNSHGSAKSWTPPTLTEISAQEDKRAAINVIANSIDETNLSNDISTTDPSKVPLPSISANVDSRAVIRHRQLNPQTLRLDLNKNDQSSPEYDRPQTFFTYAPRKSSSSDPEDLNQYYNSNRPRRRRPFNGNPVRGGSPLSNSSRSIKSTLHKTSATQTEENLKSDNQDEVETNPDLRKKHPRRVSFHLSPTTVRDRSPSYQKRNTGRRHSSYSSSEEGEVEEAHSDSFVLDDTKHRAKHGDLKRQSFGIFSSESEIYSETNQHSSSSKNESTFSDEGGHISDYRPASRESLINSEHEFVNPE